MTKANGLTIEKKCRKWTTTHVIVAILYDFDGTLAPGSLQEYSLMHQLGVGKGLFWAEANQMAVESDLDDIPACMRLLLIIAQEKGCRVIKQDFKSFEQDITLFAQVGSFFDRINALGNVLGVKVKQHIYVSSVLSEFTYGSRIAKHFFNIFATDFRLNSKKYADWQALSISYTSKTQYLSRNNEEIDCNYVNQLTNKYIHSNLQPVPFSRHICTGDGKFDVPSVKMIKFQVGITLAVINPDAGTSLDGILSQKVSENLIIQNKVDFLAPADYSDQGLLDALIKMLIIYIRMQAGHEVFRVRNSIFG